MRLVGFDFDRRQSNGVPLRRLSNTNSHRLTWSYRVSLTLYWVFLVNIAAGSVLGLPLPSFTELFFTMEVFTGFFVSFGRFVDALNTVLPSFTVFF